MIPVDDREQRLDQAVAAFHQARESGDDPKASDWIERHPDLAPDLEENFQMDGPVGWVADADVPRAPGSGTTFGPYRILRVIGRGGAEIVYEAEHSSTGRHVALKVLPSCVLSDPRQAERFRREIEVLIALDHRHILPILDSCEYGGIPYFAMPKIDGLDLRSAVRQFRHQRRSGSKGTPIVRDTSGLLGNRSRSCSTTPLSSTNDSSGRFVLRV